jgi:hypothetical protein
VQYIVWFIMHHFPFLDVFFPEGVGSSQIQNEVTIVANGMGSRLRTPIFLYCVL